MSNLSFSFFQLLFDKHVHAFAIMHLFIESGMSVYIENLQNMYFGRFAPTSMFAKIRKENIFQEILNMFR